jgi:hypothetical protein
MQPGLISSIVSALMYRCSDSSGCEDVDCQRSVLTFPGAVTTADPWMVIDPVPEPALTALVDVCPARDIRPAGANGAEQPRYSCLILRKGRKAL